MTDLVVDGILRTVSPLHISDLAKNLRYDPARDRVVRGGSRVGFPVTGHRQMEFLVPGLASEENPGGIVSVPVLPANGFRGRLRRAGAAEVQAYLTGERHEKLSYNAYQAMHSGAVSGAPDGAPPNLDEVQRLRAHAFAGLFGGGSRMMPSRLRVATGLPLVQGLFELGAIPDRYADLAVPTTQAWRLLSVMPVVRNDDLAQFLDPDAEDVVADYNDVMMAMFAAETTKRQRRSAAQDGTEMGDEPEPERGLRALSAIQVVTPGTPFYVRFEVVGGTDAQCGLLLHALLRMLQYAPRGLGGKTAVGFGRFTHALAMTVDGERDTPFTGQQEGTGLNVLSPAVQRLATAFEAELQTMTAASFDGLMGPKAAA